MSNKELIERLTKPFTPTIYGQDVLTMREAAHALELADKRIAELERNEGGGCTLAGPGRGDCEHYVGLQDGAVDAYGKPNGWCWSCWKSRRIAELEEAASFNFEQYQDAAKLLCETGDKLAVAREALNTCGDDGLDYQYFDADKVMAELAQIGGDDAGT